MDLVKSMMIAASGMRAQSGRMRVLAENIANSQSTATVPGEDPYRRQIVTFRSELDRELGANVVRVGKPIQDQSDFELKYMPGHPAADENGYVQMPNVNGLVEAMDMKEAQRSYEANLNMIQVSRRMLSQTIELLRR
ncbi:flagellar basal body rod protein FlgC [Parvibaculum lavamentivorans]|nr:flagellar basal body rod protein FlgC [Parvibaculum lavamentivorans]